MSLAGLRPQASFLTATLLLAAAVWLPPVTLQRPTWRYVVTFDLTQSMDVPDQRLGGMPVSRLAMSRAAAREALQRLPCGSQLGWSVFADYRVMLLATPVEVCAHHEELLAALEAIDGRMRWADASKVGKGASWVVRTARALDPPARVVFLTDGHESPPLRSASESPPVQDLVPGEIGGWLIGVGGDLPQRIPRSDDEGREIGHWDAADVVQRSSRAAPGTDHEHLSELRETHLRGLGELLGLGYRRLSRPSDLADAMLDPALVTREPVATDLRWLPALLALAVLVLRFLPERPGLRWRWRHRRPT
jgi:mxaL protein